jgi:hypothetical protein
LIGGALRRQSILGLYVLVHLVTVYIADTKCKYLGVIKNIAISDQIKKHKKIFESIAKQCFQKFSCSGLSTKRCKTLKEKSPA